MSKFVFLKSLRELLVPLKRLIDKKAEAPDWNENDSASASYIANRTHYKEEKETDLLPFRSIPFYDYSSDIYIPSIGLEAGRVYTVIFEDKEYNCMAKIGEEGIVLGGSNSEPFAIIDNPYYDSLYITIPYGGETTCTIQISGIKTTVHKIPSEYLPQGIGQKGSEEGAEIFNDYNQNIASGSYSHAEGSRTEANGAYSHAEGYRTYANDYGHAEGYRTNASGYYAHAEGYYAEANNSFTHAEGSSTYAQGTGAHAEGYSTYANGVYSHTEGYSTQADSQYQHVQGKYNSIDSANKYAHIVGNGTSISKRKNAHTIDWNGLGWFADSVKVGGTSQDDTNAKTLATEGYVDNKIAEIPTPDISGQIEEHNTSNTAHNDIREFITAPKNSVVFIDQVNGYHYIACMRDGNFVTYCAIKSIEITQMPTKINYTAGEYFDPEGMIITATYYDGVIKEITDYTYYTEVLTEDISQLEITYNDSGINYSLIIPLTVIPFDPTVVLIDFEYTSNEDGTYTLTGWKETLNGEASTELIIPNNSLIKV